jgi:hypothetical protein
LSRKAEKKITGGNTLSKRLEKLKLVKGVKWERMDDIDNIGVPTYTLIKDAIKEGKYDLAKDLIDYVYFWEIKLVRDVGCDLVAGFPQFVMTRYGEDNLPNVYKTVLSGGRPAPPPAKTPVKPTDSPLDHALLHGLWMVRPHRMGRNDGVGGFILDEYEDRYEVVWDPCYSGGRTRRGDPMSNSPSHMAAPYNYQTNKVAHNWTWGKTGVSTYCMHCCLLHEIGDIDRSGYLGQWVTNYPENPWDHCGYIAYKDIDWIPEKYYTRLGKVKPPVTSKNPAPKNPKLIKSTHSHDLGAFWKVKDGDVWLNLVVRLKNSIDAKDKPKAIKLVDWLWAETAVHHAFWPIEWNWKWIDYIAEYHGYNELYYALREFYSRMEPTLTAEEPRPTKADIPDALTRVKIAANWGRGDFSGPNQEASVKIVEEEDRYVMKLLPCGSGGQGLTRREPASGPLAEVGADLMYDKNRLAARNAFTEAPSNCKAAWEAHAVTWGKKGIPNYCTRCCAHFEIAAVARHGYLPTVIERPANTTDPNCKWYFYKDLDDVPEKFYTRIGARKPAVQVTAKAKK